jgi:hypothetical protein
VPIIVAPCAKPPLAAHRAFVRSLDFLRECGAVVTLTEGIRPPDPAQPFVWSVVIEELPPVSTRAQL